MIESTVLHNYFQIRFNIIFRVPLNFSSIIYLQVSFSNISHFSTRAALTLYKLSDDPNDVWRNAQPYQAIFSVLLFIVRRTQHCGVKLSYTTINKATCFNLLGSSSGL